MQEHVCSQHCSVHLLFGNCYKCESSGQIHICDQNCTQLMDWGRDTVICKVSRKVSKKQHLAHCSSLERCDTSLPSFDFPGLRILLW